MSSANALGDLPSFDRQSEGSWLYQHAGNLYGPVPTQTLLDRMRLGQLGADIVVCADGGDDFVPVLDHSVLKPLAEKAIAEGVALKKKHAAAQRKQRQRTVMLVFGIVGVLAVGLGGLFGYRYWENSRRLAKIKADALVAEERARIEAEARKGNLLAVAQQQDGEPEMDLDQIPLVSVSLKKKTSKKAKGGRMVDDGPQGCQLDQAAIATTWRTGFPSLKGCVKDQMKRSDATPEALTIEFVIQNNGSVSGFDIDDRSLKGSPFYDCLKKSVTSLHFPSFPGERCNIAYPISIGKRK